MAGREAWCSKMNSDLSNENTRIEALTELKNHLSTVPTDEVSQTATILQLPLIFDCLNDSNAVQIDLACDVLSQCMASLNLGESISCYVDYLERALYHPMTSVKLMALKEIQRSTKNQVSLNELCNKTSLIRALVACISDEDLSVATKAGDIVTEIGKIELGLTKLLQPPIVEDINRLIKAKDIVRFRIYDIIVTIACMGPSALQAVHSTGWIPSLMIELQGSDVLLQLNGLELLTQLASQPHGRVYLEQAQLPSLLAAQFARIKEDVLASVLLPGLLKFFGNLAHWEPRTVFAAYPGFLEELFDRTNLNDSNLLLVILDTIGHIASTNAGKEGFSSLGEKMSSFLQHMGNRLLQLPMDARLRALECFEDVVHVPLADQNNRICTLTQNWFNALSSDTMSVIVEHAKNPFPEIRLAGLKVLAAIAEQFWGQQLIIQTPGLLEFLLDRTEENTKESKDVKYSIVKFLAESSILDDANKNRVSLFVSQGPYYVPMLTEVAIESRT